MFEISYSRHSNKVLQTLDKHLAERILEKIKLLQHYPISHDTKRIEGQQRKFRLRVGKYRVLYEIDWDNGLIIIENIDKRSRIYHHP